MNTLADLLRTPKLGARYRHYTGRVYEVVLLAIDADLDRAHVSFNDMVVYRDVETGQAYTRSMAKWFDWIPRFGSQGGDPMPAVQRFTEVA